eukprot:1833779-Pyramimonas_sp.AAC.1
MVDRAGFKRIARGKALHCTLDADELAHGITPAASGKVAAHRALRRGVLSLAAHAAVRATLEMTDAAKHRRKALQGPAERQPSWRQDSAGVRDRIDVAQAAPPDFASLGGPAGGHGHARPLGPRCWTSSTLG